MAVGAVIGFIKVLGKIGEFLSKYSGIISTVAVAIGTYVVITKLAAVATLGFGKAMLIVKKAQQAYAFWTYTTTGAVTGLAGAMNLLKTAFLTNPVGIILAAVVALGFAFKMAWEKSETFRKLVIGAIQGVLSAVSGGLRFLGKLPGGLGKFFTESANDVDSFSKSLDKMKTKTKSAKDAVSKVGVEMPDLSKLGSPTGGARIDAKAVKAAELAAKAAAAAAKRLAEAKEKLEESVSDYNDYLANDFAKSFEKGADGARDSVLSALDKLNAVFEAKGKLLDSTGLEKVRDAFKKVNKDVRASMAEYAKVAGDIESITKELDSAEDKLNDAIKERAKSMEKFGELLRKPFGEPSAIDKAMRDAEASVDSIISMYDTLVEAVNQRFTGMEQGAKSLIVDYLTDQTAALVKLVKRRNAAVDALKDAEADLKEVLETQAKFQATLTSGVKDFAKALITLSDADTKAVLTVTKTASGLVISQVKKASTGVDSIVKQLTTRLTQVVTFGKNIESLLAAGLSREYIQQLLEAGPAAASETAALLTTASAEQIAQINSLYTQINTQATSFGTQMSKTFYDNSVSMAQAFVTGAAAEVANINKQMTAITDGIKIIMGVLGNTGLTSAKLLIDGLIAGFGEVNKTLVGVAALGVTESVNKALSSLSTLGTSLATDLAQGLFDKLSSEKARLVALAQSIAAAIAAAMASAASSIGVIVDGASDAQAAADAALEAAQALSDATTKAATDKAKADKVAADKLTGGSAGSKATSFLDKDKNGIPDLIQLPKGFKTTTSFAPQTSLNPIQKPVSQPKPVKMPAVTYLSAAGTKVNAQGVPQVSKPAVTVNIQTPKVAATTTANTIAKAVVKQTAMRR
jgi:hypothetical protein